MSEMAETPTYWKSDTHHGSLKHFTGTTTEFGFHDLGFWAEATETKSGRAEHTLPYGDTVDEAINRLTEKYSGFHVVEQDAVAEALR